MSAKSENSGKSQGDGLFQKNIREKLGNSANARDIQKSIMENGTLWFFNQSNC